MKSSKIVSFWQSSKTDKDEYYFIAEVGNNHNGSVELAKQLIDVAVGAGVDCVKFQMRDMESLYRKNPKLIEDLGVEYTKDLLAKYNLSIDEHIDLMEYTQQKNVDYICTPWDLSSVEKLESFGVPAYKVSSADFTNLPLLTALKKTKKPLILSTGMTTQRDLNIVFDFLDDHVDLISVLHCNSTYPAPFGDINLRQMTKLRKYARIIGYSGHERGIAITTAAYALGARILERHITLDRNMEGPDHAASLMPDELYQLMSGLREIRAGLGNPGPKVMTQGEMINRENLGKSLVASRDLQLDEIVKPSDIKVVSPGRGLSPLKLEQLVGRKLKRSIAKDEFFENSDINDNTLSLKSNYNIMGNWGLPVRYHDFPLFSKKTKAKMWEFHLSYKDLEVDVSKLDFENTNAELIVHAPELFSDSHLLDLTSPDKCYRKTSISNMKTVISQTKFLSEYFQNDYPIKIVTNVGGFSMDEPLADSLRDQRYEILEASLHQLADPNIEIIPQTMAPFPWHFGGQRYQNIFLDADEITQWCTKLNLRMCLDTSHSKLQCNYRKQSFIDFVTKVLPHTVHIHLGDAKSINGEGLQIGEGDIDFVELFALFKNEGYQNSILPEIWQGHKNGGHGFAVALEKMEVLSK